MSQVVVVGAGIAGLAAAYELHRAGAEVLVLESEARAGGVIVSEHPAPGWVVEGGPDSVVAADPVVPTLAAELGVGDRLVGQTAAGSSLWDGSTLAPLSEGEAARLLGIEAGKSDLAAGFRTFAGGMEELVAALLNVVGTAVHYRVGVTSLHPEGTRYRLSATGGTSVAADGVVLAIPAYQAARLVRGIDREVAAALEEIRYWPSLTVSLAYRQEQLGRPLEGTGFVVQPGIDLAKLPSRVRQPLFGIAVALTRLAGVVSALRACTYSSNKFAGRAPAGHALLRAFLLPVERPEGVAHEGLAAILGVTGEPLWTRVHSWPRGLPRPGGDHAARLAAIRERLARHAPLALAGAGYEAPSVSACVRSGRAAGREILRRLAS